MKSLWMSDCHLTPREHFSAVSWREQVHFNLMRWWRCLLCTRSTHLGCYSASSLKQVCGTPLDTISLFRANQSLFLLFLTDDLPHSRRAYKPLRHGCCLNTWRRKNATFVMFVKTINSLKVTREKFLK